MLHISYANNMRASWQLHTSGHNLFRRELCIKLCLASISRSARTDRRVGSALVGQRMIRTGRYSMDGTASYSMPSIIRGKFPAFGRLKTLPASIWAFVRATWTARDAQASVAAYCTCAGDKGLACQSLIWHRLLIPCPSSCPQRFVRLFCLYSNSSAMFRLSTTPLQVNALLVMPEKTQVKKKKKMLYEKKYWLDAWEQFCECLCIVNSEHMH